MTEIECIPIETIYMTESRNSKKKTLFNNALQNNFLAKSLMNYYGSYDESGKYCPNENLEKFAKFISGQHTISLRIIDWFVTNYAKKHGTWIPKMVNNVEIRFLFHQQYKNCLTAYSKKCFDPFCRVKLSTSEYVNMPFLNGQYIQTNIGQLNFFKWAFENNIIEYIEKNYDIIEKDMNMRNSSSRNKKCLTPDNITELQTDITTETINNINHTDSVIVLNSNNNKHTIKNTATLTRDSNNKTRKKREELSESINKNVRIEPFNIKIGFAI